MLSSSHAPSPIAADWRVCSNKGENVVYVAWLVTRIKSRLNTLGIDYWSVGQCKGQIYVFIKEPEDAVDITKLLEPQEEELTHFILL